MTLRDYTANVISATKVVPDGNFKDSKASGVWDINEALDLIKGGNWPNAANFNPAAFVNNLFQTHLYTGNGTDDRAINNGIDLSSKGGMVWIKNRDYAFDHLICDTERGITKGLRSNQTYGENNFSDRIKTVTSTGFTIGTADEINSSNTGYTGSLMDYCSWTFRKQPKFFDIVTYTGDGNSGRTVSHSLGSVPGMIIVKQYSAAGEPWEVYHRGVDSTAPEDYRLVINSNTDRLDGSTRWNGTAPTSTEFTLGNESSVNASGSSYVAYLFAHNNNDGGFGEPGDQDIIKCGSYAGNGSTDGPEINLGFEPQFIMMKKHIGGTGNWFVADVMRGLIVGGSEEFLRWNGTTAESNVYGDIFAVTPTGFKLVTTSGTFNDAVDEYIYMAIRRGGMQTPSAASDVFSIHNRDGEPNSTELNLGNSHLIDMVMSANRYDAGTTYRYITDRLRGDDKLVFPSGSDAESTGSNYIEFDRNSSNAIPAGGWGNNSGGTGADSVFWMWKRARGYFDVVAYTGNGVQGRNISHNLGVAPDMMWIKNRDDQYNDWEVYVSGITHLSVNGSDPDSYGSNPATLRLNKNDAANFSMSGTWDHTHPTSSVFRVGDTSSTNGSGEDLIAYLFATLSGVSKVGSFTQSGATNVDCGFTGSTPALIILKRHDSSGDWIVFDSVRGIVAGNDPSMDLNNSDAEVTNADIVDPYSSGFATTSSLANGNYIFYAVAGTS